LRSSEPFSVDEIVEAGSLADAFDRFVFNHPRIVQLREIARRAAHAAGEPFFNNVGLTLSVERNEYFILGRDYEPLPGYRDRDYEPRPLSERDDDEPWGSLLAKHNPVTPEERAFCREINLHAKTLVAMLRSGRVATLGHNYADGRPGPILPAIWTRDDFYVRLSNGDVCEDTLEGMKPLWIGVMLKKGVLADERPLKVMHFDTTRDPELSIISKREPAKKASSRPRGIDDNELGKPRGPEPIIFERAQQKMRELIDQGEDIYSRRWTEEALSKYCGVSRDTARRARNKLKQEKSASKASS
jgi:hypothetical protein